MPAAVARPLFASWLPGLALLALLGLLAGCGPAARPAVPDDARATFTLEQTDAQGDAPDVPVQYSYNVVLRGPHLQGELLRFEFPQDASDNPHRLAIWPLVPVTLDADGRTVLQPAAGATGSDAAPALQLPVRVRAATDAELDAQSVGRPDAASEFRLEVGTPRGRARPAGAGWRAQTLDLPPDVVADLKLVEPPLPAGTSGLCSPLQQTVPVFSGPGAGALKPLARVLDTTVAAWAERYASACATAPERRWAAGLTRVRMVQPAWLVVDLRGATTTAAGVVRFEGAVFNYDLSRQRLASLGDFLLPDDRPALGRALVADAESQLAAQGVPLAVRQRFLAERLGRPEPWDDWRLTRPGLAFRFYLPAAGQRLVVNMSWDRLKPWLKRDAKMPDDFAGGSPADDSGAFSS